MALRLAVGGRAVRARAPAPSRSARAAAARAERRGAGAGGAEGEAAPGASTTGAAAAAALGAALFACAAPAALAADAETSYSQASYYTSLGLFAMSFPGVWSLVKRSAKSKVDRKTFEIPGPAAAGAVPLDQTARQVSEYFKSKNYRVADAGEVITFEGNIAPTTGTASYITFCTFLGLLSLALVLSIQFPAVGNYWYGLSLLSPLAGTYYMSNAGRQETMKVKMVTADDESVTDLIIEGDVEEIDRFRTELQLMEKGMVYVKGILEN